MSIPGTWFLDRPRRQEHVPRDWNSPDCPCFVLWPTAARRGGRLGAFLAPGPGALPSGGLNVPRVWLLVYIYIYFFSASLSATLGSLYSVLLVEHRPNRLSGRSVPWPPGSALGAPSRLSGPGLHLLPRPCPLSPGRLGSRRPQRCPSGPATFQTWAGLHFAARSLLPPLARCVAVTWRLSSQLRVIFLCYSLLGQSFSSAAAGSGLSLRPRASARVERARRRR